MERMEELGVPRQTVAFRDADGYSFNLDGSTLYSPWRRSSSPQAAGPPLVRTAAVDRLHAG